MFSRTELLLGTDGLEALRRARVIVFGVGGVGSWCTECLVRSGVTHITLVDNDEVNVTNINRQLMATTLTVGQVKVEAMRDRLLTINPEAEIKTVNATYNRDDNAAFHLEDYDYIIDCIDSLKDKAALLINATNGSWGEQTSLVPDPSQRPYVKAKVFSSMGAALKMDATQVRVAEYWKVRGCPLGAALRKKMKRAKQTLGKPVMSVYSEELLENRGFTDETCDYKAVVNGTLSHITGVFGLTLAGLVIQDIITSPSAAIQE